MLALQLMAQQLFKLTLTLLPELVPHQTPKIPPDQSPYAFSELAPNPTPKSSKD